MRHASSTTLTKVQNEGGILDRKKKGKHYTYLKALELYNEHPRQGQEVKFLDRYHVIFTIGAKPNEHKRKIKTCSEQNGNLINSPLLFFSELFLLDVRIQTRHQRHGVPIGWHFQAQKFVRSRSDGRAATRRAR